MLISTLMDRGQATCPYRVVGRYAICDEIASGGMATVRFGRLLGSGGFARTVAIKCLHPQFAKDPNFVSGILDEGRLVGRINDPHVVPVLDVVASDEDLFLVMEYVHGEALARLIRIARQEGAPMPVSIAASILAGTLRGLQAAHEAKDEMGEPLGIIHRDISPHNILVGVDGVARVTDFGIAKATGRLQNTVDGQLKGKLNYMAPEQYIATEIDQRVDIFAAAVVLWEALTGIRLFEGDRPAAIMHAILEEEIESPSRRVRGIPAEVDAIVMRGLARDPNDRFSTALEMAHALERAVPVSPPPIVGEWVSRVAKATLQERFARRARIEAQFGSSARFEDVSRITSKPAGVPGASGAPVRATSAPTPPGISIEEADTVGTGADVLSNIHSPEHTDLSVTTPAPLKRPFQRPRFLAYASVAFGLLISLIVALLTRSDPPALAQRALASPVSSTWFLPPAIDAATPETDDLEILTPDAAVPPRLKLGPRKDAGVRTPPPNPTSKAPPLPCSVPYWVDTEGIRHPKKECLGK